MDHLRKNRVRIGTIVALIAIGAVIWLTVAGGGDSKTASNGAEIVSANELREMSALGATAVYWAGERPGAELELSQPGGGRTYVRYLTGGAQAGDPRPGFLTVGTYEQANAAAALRRQSRQPGGELATAPGRGIVYFNRRQPHSVYLAYPGVSAEIEVYDPNFKTALQLVSSGRIAPVG